MRLRLLGQALAAVAMLTLATAAPASAHTRLLGSDPVNGARLTTPPTTVTLTFDEKVQAPAMIAVVGTLGRVDVEQTTIDGGKVTVGVQIPRTSAAYDINYRVVSDDGHPVSGALHFAVMPPGQSPTAAPVAVKPKSSSHLPIYLGAGAVALAAILGAGLALRRRG